jgi:hypothetical protein
VRRDVLDGAWLERGSERLQVSRSSFLWMTWTRAGEDAAFGAEHDGEDGVEVAGHEGDLALDLLERGRRGRGCAHARVEAAW